MQMDIGGTVLALTTWIKIFLYALRVGQSIYTEIFTFSFLQLDDSKEIMHSFFLKKYHKGHLLEECRAMLAVVGVKELQLFCAK